MLCSRYALGFKGSHSSVGAITWLVSGQNGGFFSVSNVLVSYWTWALACTNGLGVSLTNVKHHRASAVDNQVRMVCKCCFYVRPRYALEITSARGEYY